MREIKFRGMGINGEWYYGNLSIIKQRIKSMGIDPGSYISNKAGIPFAYRVRPETVGQYTGAKKFFEGDVIDCNGLAGLIVWNEKTHTWGVRLKIGDHIRTDRLCDWDEEATVIGTKYENPKPLEASHAIE
ncbi:YopX family protein [Bacillus spizizenii]|uniref:YopX family protein n=1 Tax=Bacillus spizizenii TaxID=96241 RepID=UPI002E218705|nr:YopX family protein [Bacillus spizizenii]MED1069028.1 YopX family protein [Bacillus spizizenii]